jgi:hypothetical protein
MDQEQEVYLRDFYRQLDGLRPLSPTDKAYVDIYRRLELSASDPVEALRSTIEWSYGSSAQLFSGFRGTGKSTELRRLEVELKQADGQREVLLCDMKDYLNLSTPVDISDFLLALAGALGEKLGQVLESSQLSEGVWTRLVAFLSRTRVELADLGLSGGPAELKLNLKLNLKQDPTFRQRLQQHLAGHLGALTREVHEYVEACVEELKQARGRDASLVLIIDSVEQIRGTGANGAEVADSLVNLFQVHADKLRLPQCHVVCTVPPWLKIKAPATATLYDSYQQIPCVKVRDPQGRPFQPGLDALEQVVASRGDWGRLLKDRAQLDSLLLASGGYLRDLFRLLQVLLRSSRGRSLPVTEERLRLGVSELRSAYLPLSIEDCRWLAEIERSRSCQLPDVERLPDLARYFDNLLILTWRNGEEWYGVHPLLVDHVREIGAVASR